jgi:archaemetzincin
MLISVTLIERTVPGFRDLLTTIGRAFGARITTGTIDFPVTRSFRASRKQYDAALMLRELRPSGGKGEIDLFIFREDLFAGEMAFVFGLAQGRSCIVSTHRLDPRVYGEADMQKAASLFRDRLAKEAIHEVGHCLGLPHCEDKKCVMAFSDSIEGVDSKGNALCGNCKKALYLKPSGE